MLSQIKGLNSNGFLSVFENWTEDFSIEMAKENNLDLTECHWVVIHFLREYFSEYGIAPQPREIIKKIGNKIEPDVPCSRKRLEGLFEPGGCKLACKIAGLPGSYCRGL